MFFAEGNVDMEEKKDVKIYINSVRYEVEASLFTEETDEQTVFLPTDDGDAEPEKTQIKTHGVRCVKDGRTEISYEETELTGMEGSRTIISYTMADKGVVTMMRTGAVSTALVFEKGKRHHCVYQTPYMPFEVCVRTLEVKNDIDTTGCMELDYIVEIRGARAEHTKFSIRVIEE